jgi:subtilisin-like proprotein convertase family protein
VTFPAPPVAPPRPASYIVIAEQPIRDLSTTISSLLITNMPGNAPANLEVSVDITHTYRGDLAISLVAPDGTTYLLEDIPNNDSNDNVLKTYTVNVSSESASGTWRLRVDDTATGDTGTLNSWGMTFP